VLLPLALGPSMAMTILSTFINSFGETVYALALPDATG